jgi:hypothetical protein
MKTFAVDENNDIFLDKNGNLAIDFNAEAVSSVCGQVVKTTLGELVYNTSAGIPYFETIWNGNPRAQQFQAAIRTAILQVPNVIQTQDFTYNQVNDVFNYSVNIVTTFGGSVVNGQL